MPIITAEDSLVEDSAHSAQETLFSAMMADMIDLALGFLISIHSWLIGNASTLETGYWYLRISGKVYTRRSHYTAIDGWLGIGLSFSAVLLSLFFLWLRS